jgi:hypothetical protein
MQFFQNRVWNGRQNGQEDRVLLLELIDLFLKSFNFRKDRSSRSLILL